VNFNLLTIHSVFGYNWGMFTLYPILFFLEACAMSYPVITFTSGHISIKRGKKIRQYTPGFTNYKRLSELVHNGPCYHHDHTIRSEIYLWCGESTLDYNQRELLDNLMNIINNIELTDYEHPDFKRNDLSYLYGYREACRNAGIHELLLRYDKPA